LTGAAAAAGWTTVGASPKTTSALRNGQTKQLTQNGTGSSSSNSATAAVPVRQASAISATSSKSTNSTTTSAVSKINAKTATNVKVNGSAASVWPQAAAANAAKLNSGSSSVNNSSSSSSGAVDLGIQGVAVPIGAKSAKAGAWGTATKTLSTSTTGTFPAGTA
jgi:hypothetical protein